MESRLPDPHDQFEPLLAFCVVTHGRTIPHILGTASTKDLKETHHEEREGREAAVMQMDWGARSSRPPFSASHRKLLPRAVLTKRLEQNPA
jgi:hypothetical protein